VAPLCALVGVTFTASWHKIFDPNPGSDFSPRRQLTSQMATAPSQEIWCASSLTTAWMQRSQDFWSPGSLILLESILEWVRVLSGRKAARVKESPFVATRFTAEEA